jgi:hypothetical protein
MYREFNEIEIPYSRCTINSTTFKKIDKDVVSKYPIEDYYCMDWDNLTL